MLTETSRPDRATGRFYCSECFLPTLEVQLAALNVDIDWDKLQENQLLLTDASLDTSEVLLLTGSDFNFEQEEPNDW